MAKLGYTQNGVTKKNGRRRKRRKNPTTAAKNPARRRSVSLASVKAFAKRNGLKVAKVSANPRRKHHKRRRKNGLTKIARTRNGILGNTTNDIERVGGVLGGALGTKALSRVVQNFLAPYLAQVGLGNYAEIIIDGAIALTLAPMVGKRLGGQQVSDMARLGGLLATALDIVEMVAPNALSWSPFNVASPVVLGNGSQPLLTTGAVNQLVQSTDASAATKTKIAGVLSAMQAGQMPRRTNRVSLLPIE